MDWQTIYNENGIEGSVLIEDEKPVRLSVSPADYDGNEVEQAFEKAYPGYKLDSLRWDSPSGEDCVVCPIEEVSVIAQITAELDRLCLSPIPNEQEGVDAFAVAGHPELVVLADQEVECLNAKAVLNALKTVETPDEDEDDRETYERYGYAIQDLEEFDVEYDGEEYQLEEAN